jgi:hypothetical protein
MFLHALLVPRIRAASADMYAIAKNSGEIRACDAGDKMQWRATSMKSLGFVLLYSVFAAMTWGQAAVESAVAAGASTGAAAGAKGAGQAVGGVFGALSKTLDQAPKAGAPASTSVTPSAATATSAKAVSVATKPIDPAQVTVGMERDEVLSRFGEPATRTSQIRRAQMLDTFWYKTESKDELIVSLIDGKVASTVLASQRKRAPVASVRR